MDPPKCLPNYFTPSFAPPPALKQLAWAGIVLALAGAAFFATKGIVIKLALLEGIDARHHPHLAHDRRRADLRHRRHHQLPPQDARGHAAGAPPLLTWPVLLQTLGVGVIGYYVASLLDFSALEYISAQLDRLILLTYPFFVVLFGAVFFKRRITAADGRRAAGLLCSASRVIFWHDLRIEGDNVLLGAALVFGSAVVYAAYQIIAKPLIDRLGAELFTSIAMSGAGPAVIAHFLLTHPVSDLAVTGNGFLLMLAIGTISTVLPAYCISGAIGLIGPERTAIIGNVSPVVTVGLAISILGEAFTIYHAIGTALVLGGVFLFTRKEKPRVKVLEESTA